MSSFSSVSLVSSAPLLLPSPTPKPRRRWRVRSSSEESTHEMRVCTNRTCRKQGSFQILETLSALAPPDLLVKPCGCLGRCGSGPNLVVLPQGLVLNHCATSNRAAEISLHFSGIEISSAAVTDALTAMALRNRALTEIEKGNFSEGESLLTQVLKKPITHLGFRICSDIDRNSSRRWKSYMQAIDLKPFGGLHRMLKDRSIARLGILDCPGALEDIKQSQELAPNYAEADIAKGDVLVAMGEYDLAEESYLKGLHKDASLRSSKTFKARINNLRNKFVDMDTNSDYI